MEADAVVGDVDEVRFRQVSHRYLTIIEVADPGQPDPSVRGWRLWCMNCDLQGDLIHQDRSIAMVIANQLRGIEPPFCEHRTRAVGDNQ